MLKLSMNYFINPDDLTDIKKIRGDELLSGLTIRDRNFLLPEFAGREVFHIHVSADPNSLKETLSIMTGKLRFNEEGGLVDDFIDNVMAGIGSAKDKQATALEDFEEKWGWKPSEELFDTILEGFITKDCVDFMTLVLSGGASDAASHRQFIIQPDNTITEISGDDFNGLMERDPRVVFPEIAGQTTAIAGVGFYEFGETNLPAHPLICPVFEFDEKGMVSQESLESHNEMRNLLISSEEELAAARKKYKEFLMELSEEQARFICLDVFGEKHVNKEFISMMLGKTPMRMFGAGEGAPEEE